MAPSALGVVEDGPTCGGAGHRRSKEVVAGSSRPPTTTSPSPRLCSRAARTTASGALTAVGDADDQRPADPGAENGLWVLAGILRSHGNWGFGMSVRTRRTHLGPSVGSYGWPGFYGTAWYNDPAEHMTTIFYHAAGTRGRPEAADVTRLLDRCLPGDRRLTGEARRPPGQARRAHTRRPETGAPGNVCERGWLPPEKSFAE